MVAIGRILSRLARSGRNFLTWWIGELQGMTPAWARRPLGRTAPDALLWVLDDEIVVRWSERQQRLPRPKGSATPPAHLAQLIGVRRPRVAVVLGPDQVLHRRLDLPIGAETDLRDVLAFEIDRQTPFAPDEVYFDHAIRQRDAARQTLRVDLLVAPRRLVDQVMAMVQAMGGEPVTVGVAGPGQADAARWDLLAGTAVAPRRAARRHRVAFALLALLALGSGTLPLFRLHEAAAAAADSMRTVRQDLDRLLALRTELQVLREEGDFLTQKKQTLPSPIRVLNELSKLFPDDTWLFEFHMAGREGRVLGYSSKAAALIGLLERSGPFANVRFRSPVTLAPGGQSERFDLSFELTAGGAL